MKRNFPWITLLIVLSACGGSSAVEWKPVVENGKAVSVIMDYDGWHEEPGYMSGDRTTNMLYGRYSLRNEEFQAELEFSSHEKDGLEPVMFVEFGGNHCWFDYREGNPRVWVAGPAFGDTLFLPETAPKPEKGEKVKLRFHQFDDSLNIFLNEKSALKTALLDSLRGKVGVYTRYGETRLYNFSMSGKMDPVLPESYADAVFKRGESGYNCFRIPALARTPQGTLIAVCEGRKNSRSDFGDVDLVMKRSTDEGKSWGPLTLLHEEGDTAQIEMGNPAVVTNQKTGRIHVIFSRKIEILLHLFSDDEGKTWQGPDTLHTPDQRGLYPNLAMNASPGHGIQLQSGAHAGRLLVPVYTRLPDSARYLALDSMKTSVIFSDDDGRTWKAGPVFNHPGSNESTVAELSDGKLLLLVRLFKGPKKIKYKSLSPDGGATWSSLEEVADLMDPICQASLLAVPADPAAEGRQLFFLNPAHPVYYNRSRLTLKTSKDDGRSWQEREVLWPQAASYTDMVDLENGKVGYLAEIGYHFNYEAIIFRTFSPVSPSTKSGLP
ncbi:MAG: exo-alpha-sialidase [Bacteroidia bacterium]|nr:exo-alpha-sialidase [Bacteroidia bacterium]